jgi:hypothetical protein
MTDRREAFAGYFCRALRDLPDEADAAFSGRAWLGLPGTDLEAMPGVTGSIEPRPIVIIPGMFGECVARWTTPFADAHALLRAQGHRVHVLDVEGRSSSASNGRAIDAWMRRHAGALENAVVLAYSKGATDFMHAAVPGADEGGWLQDVAALVTVSGVINGTPLAADWAERMETWLSAIDVPVCGAGDGRAVDSQTYAEAGAARDAYQSLQGRPPAFAVVATTDEASVNPLLAPLHRHLSEIDPLNDGQVLARDAMLPGSQLLAAACADHWSIALPFETSGLPMGIFARNNHFPRRALLLAIIEFLQAQALLPLAGDPI